MEKRGTIYAKTLFHACYQWTIEQSCFYLTGTFYNVTCWLSLVSLALLFMLHIKQFFSHFYLTIFRIFCALFMLKVCFFFLFVRFFIPKRDNNEANNLHQRLCSSFVCLLVGWHIIFFVVACNAACSLARCEHNFCAIVKPSHSSRY